MQVFGFFAGAGFQVIGQVAAYVGFAALAGVGVYMMIESFKVGESFKVDSRTGLVTTALSISFDSLGVGFALPGIPLPLAPLIATVACTTVVATFLGLTCGRRLGTRFESGAERAAGLILIGLALLFTLQHALHLNV
jgi:putative Mn2+ efflux pump MntP